MAHIDDIRAALRTASVAAGNLDRDRATAQTALDDAQALLLDVRAEAEATEATLRARIAELEGQVTEPDPPIIVDPPPPPVVGNAPSFAEFAFASRMPAWRGYVKPTEADCDWVLDRPTMRAVSKRGLPNVELEPTSAGWAGALYRRSRYAGHGPRVTIGVKGYGGQANVGGFYSGQGPEDIAFNGEPLDVQFVGLSDDAAIQVRWGGATWEVDYGKTQRLACFDIGIVGSPSNHGVVQNKSCGEIIFDNWWMVYPEGHPQGSWESGMHLANWEHLILRGLKRRGLRPTDPAALFAHHALYLKSSDKPGSTTWVLDCDLRGGNQTGVQRRPGTDNLYLGKPADTVVFADNVCDSHGHDHVNEGGGAAFTVYAGQKTFVLRNRARNSRYMSLLVSAQPRYTDPQGVTWDRNWYDDDGYALGEVYVDGNDFGNVGSPRHCVSINHARRVFYGDKNKVDGKLVFGQVGYRDAAKPSERVMLIGDFAKFPTPYTAVDATDVRMGSTEMAALHVPTWGEALQ